MHTLFYTVLEASELCNVSQPTIRKAVKDCKMKTYTDDRKRLHIYGPDIWNYYRELVTKRIEKAIANVSTALKELDKAKKEYLEAFGNLDNCEEGSQSTMAKIYAKKRTNLCNANRNYIHCVDNLRKLEYEATLIYEVNL